MNTPLEISSALSLRLVALQTRLQDIGTLRDEGAYGALLLLIDELVVKPLAPAGQLEAIESARTVVAAMQHAMASRYAAQPLPPDSKEDATLRQVTGLWMSCAKIYARLDRIARETGELATSRPLLAQRRIHYISCVIGEFFRAHRAVPEGIWRALHNAYLEAEGAGLADARATDALNESWQAQSPAEAYIACLLVDLANPFGRNPREFNWIWRWAQGFAPYCSLSLPQDGEEAAGYCLDPYAADGLRPAHAFAPGRQVRHFHAKVLAGRIRGLLEQLREGSPAASLGLGDDCIQPACGKLLVSLYRPWGLAAASRRFPRRGAAGQCLLCTDWLDIAAHVGPHGNLGTEIRARMAQPAEHWDILDQSVSGFRLSRRGGGQRVEHHQLVGVRPHDGNHFLIGQVSWLMYQADGALLAGIHLLPGLPETVRIRAHGTDAWPDASERVAFALPAVPAIQAGETLVLSSGAFKPERQVSLQRGESRTVVRLLTKLSDGSNFDQVSYEALSRGPAGGAPENAR
ncbi:MAG: hypothetical protein HGA47_09755 [Zoogloea sp.]|nr:hypothetical protein [Zoogloea sp.]